MNISLTVNTDISLSHILAQPAPITFFTSSYSSPKHSTGHNLCQRAHIVMLWQMTKQQLNKTLSPECCFQIYT